MCQPSPPPTPQRSRRTGQGHSGALIGVLVCPGDGTAVLFAGGGGWQYLEGEADHVSIERLGSPHCPRHAGKEHGAQQGLCGGRLCLGVPGCAPQACVCAYD